MSEIMDRIENIMNNQSVQEFVRGMNENQIRQLINYMIETDIEDISNLPHESMESLNYVLSAPELINATKLADMEALSTDTATLERKKQDISSLKKQIKYCRNPMQKKKLQQELSFLYRKRKV